MFLFFLLLKIPVKYLQCKEIIRPVRKSLKYLDNPLQVLSNAEQIQYNRKGLLRIGEHIDKHLVAIHDPEQVRFWHK